MNVKTALILAGGMGTRMGEETANIPKPMIEVGGIPIITHIIKHYYNYGIRRVIILAGYKRDIITNYFSRFNAINSRLTTVTIANEGLHVQSYVPDIQMEGLEIVVLDTGATTETARRIAQAMPLLKGEEHFMCTYGDGISDVNLEHLFTTHINGCRQATMTLVQSPSRFGVPKVDGTGTVTVFEEKPNHLINGGFFVFNNSLYVSANMSANGKLEDALSSMSVDHELLSFVHHGFWQCMDTPRDRELLNNLFNTKQLPTYDSLFK